VKDTCFINVGIDHWYPKGSRRLKTTLLDCGFPGDIIIWEDHWPRDGGGYNKNCVYNCKAAAFEEAIERGYKVILWGDCSMQAIRSVTPLVERIRNEGLWIGKSGYNCAQVCTDAQLAYFGITRDQAEAIPDCASGLFGVNVNNPLASAVIKEWIRAARDGVFAGSRKHAKQSEDPRFMFGRQDQSCLSLILHKHGAPLGDFIDYAKFKWDRNKGQIFHCEGM